MLVKIPYNKTYLKADIPNTRFKGIIKAKPDKAVFQSYQCSQDQLVRRSLAFPVESPRLFQLVKNKHKVVIISSDHTRPVPEKIIMPQILSEIKKGNPQAKVTILIATGTHRPTTKTELIAKFGKKIVDTVRIVVHKSENESSLTTIGKLPSRAVCKINKLAVQADLLIADGLIEPHLIAGYSGGRKAVFPGVASQVSVRGNHNGAFIANPYARSGILAHNPVNKDMLKAGKLARLAFIVNVVLDANKRIVGCFSGNPYLAHLKGTKLVDSMMSAKPIFTDITITSNGGYPLDQNLYQCVKGLTGAEATNKNQGVIILSASLVDGIGGKRFYSDFKSINSVSKLYNKALHTPAEKTYQDQWASQVFARIIMNHTVIAVTSPKNARELSDLKIKTADSISKALQIADKIVGQNASVAVLPDGISTIIKN